MIEIYRTDIEKVVNGYVVYLLRWNDEKNETESTDKHIFNNRLKAFEFARDQLGEKEVEEVKY